MNPECSATPVTQMGWEGAVMTEDCYFSIETCSDMLGSVRESREGNPDPDYLIRSSPSEATCYQKKCCANIVAIHFVSLVVLGYERDRELVAVNLTMTR